MKMSFESTFVNVTLPLLKILKSHKAEIEVVL